MNVWNIEPPKVKNHMTKAGKSILDSIKLNKDVA